MIIYLTSLCLSFHTVNGDTQGERNSPPNVNDDILAWPLAGHSSVLGREVTFLQRRKGKNRLGKVDSLSQTPEKCELRNRPRYGPEWASLVAQW